jgi:nitrite reductase/ring-hydroxylating ferredoxin subunit
MRKLNFILLLPLLLLFSTCKKEQQYVPNVYVNLVIYVNDQQHSVLQAVDGWKYFDGGNRGVIVYRKSQNEFVAYERTCPFKPEESNSIVSVDTSNNIILKDASCSAQFLLSNGDPISGPAVIPLRQFNCVFDGTTLRVSN